MTKQKLPPFYFDAKRGNYWMELNKGRFVEMKVSDIKLHIKRHGYSKEQFGDMTNLNEIECELVKAQIHRSIDYAGPLAGHKPGVFQAGSGKRILVTDGAQPVSAKRGKWTNLQRYYDQLLGTDQLDVAMYWLKCAREAMIRGDFAPGQMLVLVGSSGCGKSLFQHLVTAWLGGRSADPFRYMMGETSFNADLAESEHLMIEDKHTSADMRSRLKFGAAVKDFAVCLNMSVHGKGLKAETLQTYRRATMSANNQAENLLVIPPLIESLADKLIILDCAHADIPADRLKVWSMLSGELPAMAYALENEKIPSKWQCARYGVKHYHAPAVVEVLTEMSSESRLLSLIDQVLFSEPHAVKVPWIGTSIQLEKSLRSNGDLGFMADRICSQFPGACGTFLGRLKSATERITSVRTSAGHVWTIKWPA